VALATSVTDSNSDVFNALNAELNPICCLLALLGAHHILYVSRIRVKNLIFYTFRVNGEYKEVFNKQIAHINNGKHSYLFRLLSLAFFREYQWIISHKNSAVTGNGVIYSM